MCDGAGESLQVLTTKRKANFNIPIIIKCPIDGYGRLARMLRDNIEIDPNSKRVLYLGLPAWIGKAEGAINGIFTMFEADKLPPQWPSDINNNYDFVVVPSTWCRQVFIDSGVTVPVHLVPLAVDDFTPYSPNNSPFTFGHQNSFTIGKQKGWDMVIAAFEEEFTKKDDVRLILKTRTTHEFAIDWGWYKKAQKNKRIEIVNEDFTDKQLHEDFYGRLNCFVFPSRGEGFGLPPLEAMAHGIPTILTDAHSMHDFAHLGIGIDTVGYCDSYYYGRIEDMVQGRWVEPNYEQLRWKMRYVYENYQEEKRLAMANVSEIKELYNSERFINTLVDTVNKT